MCICSKRNLWLSVRRTKFSSPHIRRSDRKALIRCCRELELSKKIEIVLSSYKANILFNSRNVPDLMENPVVVEIAGRIGKSPAQVLLRYLLELGVAAIPKSTNANRLKSNIDLFEFELSESDKTALAGLDDNIRICDFAFFQGIQKHAEWPFGKIN